MIDSLEKKRERYLWMCYIIITLFGIIFLGIWEDFTPCPKSPKHQKTTMLSDIIQTSSLTLKIITRWSVAITPEIVALWLEPLQYSHWLTLSKDDFWQIHRLQLFFLNYCISYNVYISYNTVWNGLLSVWTLLMRQTILYEKHKNFHMKQKDDESGLGFEAFLVWFVWVF